MMLPVHVRMARAALGWTIRDLADRAKVNLNTVSRYEAGREVKSGTIQSIEAAFSDAGVILIHEDPQGGVGVRLTRESARRSVPTSDCDEKVKSKRRSRKMK